MLWKEEEATTPIVLGCARGRGCPCPREEEEKEGRERERESVCTSTAVSHRPSTHAGSLKGSGVQEGRKRGCGVCALDPLKLLEVQFMSLGAYLLVFRTKINFCEQLRIPHNVAA